MSDPVAAAAVAVRVAPGVAKIKPEFLVSSSVSATPASGSGNNFGGGIGNQVFCSESSEPEVKRVKISEDNPTPAAAAAELPEEVEVDGEEKGPPRSKRDKKHRGQNKNRDRPRPPKFLSEDKLCPHLLDGGGAEDCPKLRSSSQCPFLHDVEQYLASKKDAVTGVDCPIFKSYGKCPRGISCIFSSSHTDPVTRRNLVEEDRWGQMQSQYETNHKPLLDFDTQRALRKHQFDFKEMEKIYCNNALENKAKTLGAVTDADLIPLKVKEIKKIDWTDKLYLSPLTTVGNLPFRRLCVELGADITCSEMSLATSILQGNMHEFALHRRHPSEKLWGVQLCSNNGILCAKAAHALSECGIDYDFVDLNMGCPLDPIYRQGAGSGLMCRTNKFHSLVKGMTKVMASKDKAFTVKMRTGIKMDKNIAHSLVEFCRNQGVSAVTLHGRTREQRYLRHADWNYIGKCAAIAQPSMALFGNGDIMSWEDYIERKTLSNATGVMIGRGALIKPWVFQEIKEQRQIDMNSAQRLELIRKYVHYGLDHWGSDSQGVSTTRRFLLEWLSFYHRYIPTGILEDPPQRINQRPQKYFGRDEMETLLASPNSSDWVKISEMFLGPVPDFFEFVPKHRANAWANG